MRTVCFIGTQIQDTLNLKYVYDEIIKDKQIYAFFLNMDGVHHQNTISVLPKENTIDFGLKLKVPFYRLSLWKKLFVYISMYTKREIIPKADILVFGNLGAIEFHIARYCRNRFKSQIYLIKDSILLLPELKIKRKSITNYIYGKSPRENVCNKIFVSGEATKATMVTDNINPTKIVVSGIPRYDVLFNNSLKSKSSGDRRLTVLLLTSAYAWHRDLTHSDLQKKYIKDLIHIIYTNKNIKIILKIHPRDDTSVYKYLKDYKEIEVHHDTDAFDLIKKSDIVVSYYYPSTMLFESMHLGKKVVLLDHGFDYSLLTTPVEFTKIIKIAYTTEEAANYLTHEANMNSTHDVGNILYSEFFISPKSKNATSEIISHIRNAATTDPS